MIRLPLILVALLTIAASCTTASAVVVLQIGNDLIKGESTVANRVNWIDINSVSLNVSRAISAPGGGGRQASVAALSEVAFTKSADIASTRLFLEACGGSPLGTAKIHFLQMGGSQTAQLYYEIELSDVMVSSFSTNSNGERPSENFSLNYTRIRMRYTKFDGGQATPGEWFGWDREKNLPWNG